MRISFVLLWCIIGAALGEVVVEASSSLRLSSNRRYLEHENGTPFFYLGDTAWELFHRLNREEADAYLSDRAKKGFTVVQAVLLAEMDGLGVPNAYGHVPLEGNDPSRPVEAYFQHVDEIVNKAESLGLYMGLLPTWGDKWNKLRGVGPEIFTPENAKRYGEFLGKRYRGKPVIWILGGDRNPERDEHLTIIRAMAQGLESGHGGSQLMTFHPMGKANSSQWFHDDEWLDFNMFQSGHSAVDFPNYEMTLKNLNLEPFKPTLDGEPRYEDHPVNWNPEKGWFNDWDVRQAAYWSMLAGACGHTYGNHNLWQFWQPDRKAIASARTVWREALDHPGAVQMGIMRRLFESRPFQQLIPDQTLIQSDPFEGADHIRAARAEDDSFVIVYCPTGKPVTVKFGHFKSSRLRCYWFDPRTGEATEIGVVPSLGWREFEPPSAGRGQDWVLVIDDFTRNFPPPGKVD